MIIPTDKFSGLGARPDGRSLHLTSKKDTMDVKKC